jgi:glyoxylase-like metal-dependent hydrolase (beta-lactamase superfamily II)
MAISTTQPTFLNPRQVAAKTYILPSYLPVPGLGILPVNAFLMLGSEPLLVDTGLAALGSEFMVALGQLIDPQDLKWIWLTHTDHDHLGNLARVLAVAPQARVITTFLGMGKLALQQLPTDRVYLLNPGQHIRMGDRTLIAIQPPSYDAPETTGLFDPKTRTLFSADCFGALMQQPAETALEISEQGLQEGLVGWARVDSPWLSMVDPHTFAKSFTPLRQMAPELVLSSHLPPAPGMADRLMSYLQEARWATPTPGPDQQALEQMMAQAVPA